MKQYLHLEVPLEPGALKDTANRLNLMADGLAGPMLPGMVTPVETTIPEVAPAPVETTIPEVVPAPVETTVPEVAPAPVETTIPEVVPAPVEVTTDNRGMVHDSRIHSATPTINADGTWRNKRGVDKALLAQVEAELLGQPAPVPPVVAMAAALEEPGNLAPAPVAEAPVPPVAPAASQIETFGELMSKVTINMVNPDRLIAAVSNAGLQSIELLAARPDLVPQVAAELGL